MYLALFIFCTIRMKYVFFNETSLTLHIKIVYLFC